MQLKKNHEYLFLTLIVLLGFVLRFINLDYLIPQTDEFLHLDEAVSYEMRLPASRVFFVKYIGLGMLKPLRLLADDYLYGGRLFVVLVSTANILLVYANSRMFANNIASLAVTFLVAVSGFNIFFGSIVYIDAIITCFLLIGLLLFQKGVVRDNIALVFFAGVMFFAALANKIIVAPALLFFVALGIHYGTSLRALLPLALWFSAGCVTSMALIGISLITPDIPLFSLDQITSQISLFLSGGPSVGIGDRVAGVESFISYHHESIVALITVCGLLSLWISGSSRLFFLSILVNLGFFCAYYPAYARHMHFLSVFAALFLALFLTRIVDSPKTDEAEKRALTGRPVPMVMVIFLLLASIFTLLDTIRMKHTPYQFISDHDRHAFVDGWHSGFGMREVARKFQDILFEETGNIVVVTNYYGTPGGHYLPYLLRKHTSRIKYLKTWALDENLSKALIDHAAGNRVFLLVETPYSFASEEALADLQQQVRPVFHYDKKAADTSLTIYEFIVN